MTAATRERLRAEINLRRREQAGITRTVKAARAADPDRYQRVRAACAEPSGGINLDRHAANITLTLPTTAPNANGREPKPRGQGDNLAMVTWTDPSAADSAHHASVTLRIVSDPIEDLAVFYCTASGQAFGPGMTCDEADGFLFWILSGAAARVSGVYPLAVPGFTGRDPREYSSDDVARLLAMYRQPRRAPRARRTGRARLSLTPKGA